MSNNVIAIIRGLFKGQQMSVSSTSITPPSNTQQSQALRLDVVYPLILERLTAQKEQWTSLDVKINFILGYATALVSASLVLQAVLLTLRNAHNSLLYNIIPPLPAQILLISFLIALLVFYITTVIIGIFAYKPRAYQFVPDPEKIFQKWLNKEEEIKTREEILEGMVIVFQSNQGAIDKKIRLIDFALATLFIEAFLLVPLIAIQVVS